MCYPALGQVISYFLCFFTSLGGFINPRVTYERLCAKCREVYGGVNFSCVKKSKKDCEFFTVNLLVCKENC